MPWPWCILPTILVAPQDLQSSNDRVNPTPAAGTCLSPTFSAGSDWLMPVLKILHVLPLSARFPFLMVYNFNVTTNVGCQEPKELISRIQPSTLESGKQLDETR